MADAEAVMAGVPRGDGVTYIGLVLNERGLDRALAAGVDEVNVVVVATDTFTQRNQGIDDRRGRRRRRSPSSGRRARPGCGRRDHRGGVRLPVRGRGRPSSGSWTSPAGARSTASASSRSPTRSASAVPADVTRRLTAVRRGAPTCRCAVHLHNTRNTGYANAVAAVAAGVRALDASSGGIGGCPFAPAATGNIATEDLVYLLERSGVETGLSLAPLIEVAGLVAELLGTPTPSLLPKAGGFPPQG